MYYDNLSQFYTGKEWRQFRQAIIAERTNADDGFLYDEYNGKPILHSYDIILHHKIELTLDNVNDRSISLNPENIMVVSMKSHNEIHKRWGGRIKLDQRKVYYVWGAPMSGKSTYVKENQLDGDLVVDIDRIWTALTGSTTKFDKPNELKSIVFVLYNELINQVIMRSGTWQNAWVIEGGSNSIKRMRLIETLGAESIYIDTSKEKCLERMRELSKVEPKAKGWEQFILKWFEDYKEDTI